MIWYETSSVQAFMAGLFVFMALSPTVTAASADVTFMCDRMPEVCTNMCWAVRCANPRFPQTLTWDGTDSKSDLAKARRKAAGCSSGNNRCNAKNKGKAGYRGDKYRSCDEFPFATTSESKAPVGHQVSRCVPGNQNSAQGNALMKTYAKWKKDKLKSHKMVIAFGKVNAKDVKYCMNQPCNNDGWEIQDKKLSKRDDVFFSHYRTASGMLVASIEPLDVGDDFDRMLGDDEIANNATMASLTITEVVDGEPWITDSIVEKVDIAGLNGTTWSG